MIFVTTASEYRVPIHTILYITLILDITYSAHSPVDCKYLIFIEKHTWFGEVKSKLSCIRVAQ